MERASLPCLKLVLQVLRTLPVRPADSRVIISDPEGTPVAFGSRCGPEHWVLVPERAAFRFQAGSELVLAHPHPLADDDAVLDAYHGAALPMAVQVALGGQALHASAVVAPGLGALAFCGISYAGKTTLAFALGRRGYRIWADDILGFEARGAEHVRAVRLPFRLNLRAQTAAHFNAATGKISDAGSEFEDWTRIPLAAVFALERLDSEPWSRPAARRLSPSEALMAVLSHAFCFEPQTAQEKRRTIADYLGLVARVPVYSLTPGPDLGRLDALLDEVEATIAASAAR